MPGLPEWGTVSMIEPSPFDAATAYRRRRRPPAGRHAALSLQDDGLRSDLEAPRRPAARRTSTCTPCARIRSASGQLYRGHRARRDVLARRRRDLAAAAAEPADRGGARPGRQGRRPRRRHARALDLDPRRPDADARVVEGDRGEGGCTCSRRGRRCAGGSRARSLPGHGPRPEPAGGRRRLLLAEGGAEGRRADGDPRRARQASSAR